MHLTTISLTTMRLHLSVPEQGCAAEMLAYYQRNQVHLQPWEPNRDDCFYTMEAMAARISGMTSRMERQESLHFLLRMHGSERIIGECGFTNIVRGAFQACHLGFSLCHEFQGQGLMYEALRCAIDCLFDELGLHRVMANYRPENARSQRLLQRLGFEREGLARAYLNINGQWRDHVLTSLIDPNSR